MPLSPPDIKELKAILDWVNLTSDVLELSLKFGDVELHISREGTASERNNRNRSAVSRATSTPVRVHTPAAVDLAADSPTVSAPFETAPSAQAPLYAATVPSTPGGLAADEIAITAPMVGTFYAAPKPGDPPFVTVGDRVDANTVVGIVEVMKLMNSLEAKATGTVVQVLAANEQAVEYGQTLMVIKRDA